jgi:hypothetical protein
MALQAVDFWHASGEKRHSELQLVALFSWMLFKRTKDEIDGNQK